MEIEDSSEMSVHMYPNLEPQPRKQWWLAYMMWLLSKNGMWPLYA